MLKTSQKAVYFGKLNPSFGLIQYVKDKNPKKTSPSNEHINRHRVSGY